MPTPWLMHHPSPQKPTIQYLLPSYPLLSIFADPHSQLVSRAKRSLQRWQACGIVPFCLLSSVLHCLRPPHACPAPHLDVHTCQWVTTHALVSAEPNLSTYLRRTLWIVAPSLRPAMLAGQRIGADMPHDQWGHVSELCRKFRIARYKGV